LNLETIVRNQMNQNKTPDWLTETQNKSWEPEILISGITLTFLFLLSNYIFNFYGMLIQEFGVRYVIGKNLYIVSIVILTGLKVGLILHLIFRGIWTGFVGLSFVFPHGVNKNAMPKSKRNIDYPKPEQYVIKVEKVCSLLFSFIFSSIMFVGATASLLVLFAVLYITGLDAQYIKYIILIIIPLSMIFGIYLLLSETILKNPKFKLKIRTSILDNVLFTYFTNIGRIKVSLIFVFYFVFIGLLSIPDISKFDFNNEQGVNTQPQKGVVQLNMDHYQNSRDNKTRISKAAIEKFWIKENKIELFVGSYKEDVYTIRNLRENPSSLNKLDINADSSGISINDLLQIFINNKKISGLRWYGANNLHTNHKRFLTTIPLDSLSNGYHELKINKILWINKKKEMKSVNNWDKIPFELDMSAAKLD